jgi:hypothetical protein
MEQLWMNILLFIVILLGVYYFIFRNNYVEDSIEGMQNNRNNRNNNNTPRRNGIASNADTFIASLQQATTKLKDELSISNADYRKKYERIIVEMDNLLNYSMLKGVLTADMKNPTNSFAAMGNLNNARAALNNVLKFVDKHP